MHWSELAQLIGSIVGPLLGAIGAYAAIRSDLAAIRARVQMHGEAIDRAHNRIDSMMRGRT